MSNTMQGGILALDFEAGKENIVYTAGADHTGQVFDLENKRVVAELKGHSKKVTGKPPSHNLHSFQDSLPLKQPWGGHASGLRI